MDLQLPLQSVPITIKFVSSNTAHGKEGLWCLTFQLYHKMLYWVHLTMSGAQTCTTLVVIGTDCSGSCKSNYHMTMTAPHIENQICGVMISVLRDYEIGICCKNKDWLAWNQGNIFVWSNMSTHRLLFQRVSIIKKIN